MKQPQSCSVKAGDNAVFTVTTSGNVKSYQWYKSKDNGKNWTKTYYTGSKTSSVTVPVEKYMNNYLFYCVITDADGNQYSTETAKITIVK